MLADQFIQNDQRPVILLLGAEGEVTRQHLTEVGKELESLKAIFEPYARNNDTLFRFAYDSDLTQAELKDYLDQLAGKLSILHFAGHSDGEVLQTDDLQVYAERIADIIKVWPSPPDLIFLNGCHNDGQVEVFHAAGVPVVIATSEKVNDAVAAEFAGEFYKSLLGSDEASLHAAFTVAKQKMQLSSPNQQLPTFSTSEPQAPSSSDDSDRSPNLSTIHTRADQLLLPWLLYAQIPEQESWTLRQILTQKRPVLGEDRQPINPYKGLEAFTENDSNFFFGRETLIDELTQNIADSPLITVLGASGSGKSSLINAGVLPKLDREEWWVVSAKPGDDPFTGLAGALNEQFGKAPDDIREEGSVLGFFADHFAENSSQRKVLLFIDQFEELFTQSETEIIEAFQQQLYQLVEANLAGCHVVLVMRADFLSAALQNADFARLLNRNLDIKLAPMDEAELRAAINSPAGKQRVVIEPALLGTLLKAVEDQAGSLPLLQDILQQLWEQRENPYLITLNEYNQLGGLKKALGNRADRVLEKVSDEQQEIIKKIFLSLIKTSNDTEDTKRRAYLRKFKHDPAAEKVIQQLVNERLITSHQVAGGKDGFIELSHEALIKSWGRLREWIDSDRENINVRNQLSAAAQNWEDDQESDASYLITGARLVTVEDLFKKEGVEGSSLEKKFFDASIAARDKKKRRTYSIVSGVIVTLSFIAGVAIWQWIQAGQERDRAFNQVSTSNDLIGKIQNDLTYQLSYINNLSISTTINKMIKEYYSASNDFLDGSSLELLRENKSGVVSTEMSRIDILIKKGDLKESLGAYEKIIDLLSKYNEINPDEHEWSYYLYRAKKEYASVQRMSGDNLGALVSIEDSLSVAKNFLITFPEKKELIALSFVYSEFGEIYSQKGDYTSALEFNKLSLDQYDKEIYFNGISKDFDILRLTKLYRIYHTYDKAGLNKNLVGNYEDELSNDALSKMSKLFNIENIANIEGFNVITGERDSAIKKNPFLIHVVMIVQTLH